jgi:Response regulator containing CheY-like receiver, AAA-type ATPase, and DNA-binding domains
MALVGSLRIGTINGLVESLRHTNVQATLTVRSGEDEGVLTFRQGELEDCRVDVLDGADALDEMLSWSHGQFTLRIVDARADGAAPTASERPHVMVVDDELGVRKLIESFLEAEGYQVSVVSQASQAVNLVDYCKPDVVLLDIMLTGIDGFALTQQLREQYDRKHLPIILMSANHDFASRAEQEGYPFFGKPFNFKELCAAIDEQVGRPADRAIAERLQAKQGSEAPPPVQDAHGLALPARLASILDAESYLPDLDQCYVLDELARARFALVGPDPELAALVAGFDGFQTLRSWINEDPDRKDQRVLMALLLFAIDALHTADSTFGVV